MNQYNALLLASFLSTSAYAGVIIGGSTGLASADFEVTLARGQLSIMLDDASKFGEITLAMPESSERKLLPESYDFENRELRAKEIVSGKVFILKEKALDAEY